jgi:cytochrome c553
MIKAVLILLVTVISSGALLAHAADEGATSDAKKPEMASEDDSKTYFDYKLAFSLAGDFERGKQLASQAERFPRTCRFCHGVDGVAPGDHHPNLAGQKDKYLRSQLISFIFMQRQSHIMNRTLVDFEKEKPLYSEQEVADLAFYFSSLDPAGDGKGEQVWSTPH